MIAVAQKTRLLPARAQPLTISDPEYIEIRRLLRQTAGINLTDNKQSMVIRRLSGRLKVLELSSFSEYCEILRSGDRTELELFGNAMTTNLTAFFRENHHFELLRKTLLPKLVEQSGNRDKTIHFWSAGCSTGEEAYSLAMQINESFPRPRSVDFKILATDIDSAALSHSEKGIYTKQRFERMPEARLRRWFERGTGGNRGYFRIKPELMRDLVFKQLNLFQDWPMKNKFDVIFCRNVIIYFDKPTQKRLVERFANQLNADGYLFLGHSESLTNMTDKFSLLGQSVYRKVS